MNIQDYISQLEGSLDALEQCLENSERVVTYQLHKKQCESEERARALSDQNGFSGFFGSIGQSFAALAQVKTAF